MPVQIRMVHQVYRYALDTDPDHDPARDRKAAGLLQALGSHCGAARYAYNWATEQKYRAFEAGQPVPGLYTGLTTGWSMFKNAGDACQRCGAALHAGDAAAWLDRRDSAECRDGDLHGHGHGLPWAGQNHHGTYLAALRDADTAFARWFASMRGDLAGRPAGRPRFKARGKSRESFQLMGPSLRVIDGKHLQLPTIGRVKTFESTRKLGRRLRRAQAQAAELAAMLPDLRESAGLTVADAAGRLTAIADSRARDKAVIKAADEMAKARAALERAAREQTRAKARARVDRATARQARAAAVTASNADRWSARKLAEAERTGQVSEAQAADLCAVYQASEPARRRMMSLARQARIVRGTVSRDSAGRWHIALTAEVPREIRAREVRQVQADGAVVTRLVPAPSRRQLAGGVIGADFGARDTLKLSTGEVIANPAYLEAAQRKLRRAQQTVSRRTRRGEPWSKRRVKAVARVGRIHNRVALMRERHQQRAASSMVHRFAVIGLEGFDVQKMAAGGRSRLPGRVRRQRNRQLADAAIGKQRALIVRRAPWYGCEVLVAGAQFPGNRTCSACGTVRTTPIPPSHELFESDRCGHVMDRRLNTALVLQRWARQQVEARTGRDSENARGGDVSQRSRQVAAQSPAKREAPRSRSSGREMGTPRT